MVSFVCPEMDIRLSVPSTPSRLIIEIDGKPRKDLWLKMPQLHSILFEIPWRDWEGFCYSRPGMVVESHASITTLVF